MSAVALYGPVLSPSLIGTPDGVIVTAIDDDTFTAALLNYNGSIDLSTVRNATVTYAGTYTINVYNTSNTLVATDSKMDPDELFGAWGLTVNTPFSDPGGVNFVYDAQTYKTKEIKKLYGALIDGTSLTDISGEIDPATLNGFAHDFAHNVVSFDEDTFLATVSQDENYQFYVETLSSSPYAVDIYYDLDGSWYVFLSFHQGDGEGGTTMLSDGTSPYTFSQLGITLVDNPISGFDAIKLFPTFSAYNTVEIDKVYGPAPAQGIAGVTGGQIRPGGAGNITDFDIDKFWYVIRNTFCVTWAEGNGETLIGLKMTCSDLSPLYWELSILISDGNEWPITNTYDLTYPPSFYGVTADVTTVGDDYIDFTSVIGTVYRAKQVFGTVAPE